MYTRPFPVAARFKVWICGRSLAGIVGSDPAGGMDISVLWVLVLSCTGLCIGLITCPEEFYGMWYVWVWSRNFDNDEDLAHWGLLRHKNVHSLVAMYRLMLMQRKAAKIPRIFSYVTDWDPLNVFEWDLILQFWNVMAGNDGEDQLDGSCGKWNINRAKDQRNILRAIKRRRTDWSHLAWELPSKTRNWMEERGKFRSEGKTRRTT